MKLTYVPPVLNGSAHRMEIANPPDLGGVGAGIRPARDDVEEVGRPSLAESRRVVGTT